MKLTANRQTVTLLISRISHKIKFNQTAAVYTRHSKQTNVINIGSSKNQTYMNIYSVHVLLW